MLVDIISHSIKLTQQYTLIDKAWIFFWSHRRTVWPWDSGSVSFLSQPWLDASRLVLADWHTELIYFRVHVTKHYNKNVDYVWWIIASVTNLFFKYLYYVDDALVWQFSHRLKNAKGLIIFYYFHDVIMPQISYEPTWPVGQFIALFGSTFRVVFYGMDNATQYWPKSNQHWQLWPQQHNAASTNRGHTRYVA